MCQACHDPLEGLNATEARQILATRVDVGAAHLDTLLPGWRGSIELESLDMRHESCCILGQLYGDFCEALRRFSWSGADATVHGFHTGWRSNPERTFAMLQELWTGEIMAHGLPQQGPRPIVQESAA